jgi:dolichol kinase
MASTAWTLISRDRKFSTHKTKWRTLARGAAAFYVLALMYASIFGNVSAIIQRLYSGTARWVQPKSILIRFSV